MLILTPNDARLKQSKNHFLKQLRALNWAYNTKDCRKSLYLEYRRGGIFIEGALSASSYEDFFLQLCKQYGLASSEQLLDQYVQSVFYTPNNPILVSLPQDFIILSVNRRESIKKINGKIFTESWINNITIGIPLSNQPIAISGEIGAVFEFTPGSGFVLHHIWSSNTLLMEMLLSRSFSLEYINNKFAKAEEDLLKTRALINPSVTKQAVLRLLRAAWVANCEHPARTDNFIKMIHHINVLTTQPQAQLDDQPKQVLIDYLQHKASWLLYSSVIGLTTAAVAVISVAAIFLAISYISPLVAVLAISVGVATLLPSYGLFNKSCRPSPEDVVNQYRFLAIDT